MQEFSNQNDSQVGEQVSSFTIKLQTKYTKQQTRNYFAIITVIIIITGLVDIFSKNPIIELTGQIISIIVFCGLLSLCNTIALKHGFRNFDVIYKVVNIIAGTVAVSVVKEFWWQRYNFNSVNTICYITSILWTLISAMGMTVVSLINDGYNVDVKIKVFYSIINIIYCSYYLYIAASTHSTKVLFLFQTDYSLDWRSIAISTFITVIVFVIKQIYNIVKHPNKFSSIICYFPVVGIESVQFEEISIRNSNKIYKTSQTYSYPTMPKISNQITNPQHNLSGLTPSWIFPNATQMSPTVLSHGLDSKQTDIDGFANIEMTEINFDSNGKKDEIRHNRTANDLGLGLLNLSQHTSFKESLDIVDSISHNSPIYVNKDRTLWFLIFYKIFSLDVQKSLKYHRFMTENKILHTVLCLQIVIYFSIVAFESKDYGCYVTSFEGISRVLAGFSVVGGFLTINVDCCVYALKTNFSIYWRCYDTLITRICQYFIVYNNRLCGDDTNNSGYDILIGTVIWESIFFATIGTMGTSMVQCFLNIHFVFQFIFVLLSVIVFTSITLFHTLSPEATWVRFELLDNEYYSVDFNDYIAVKAADVSIWFMWQLVVMYIHRDQVRVANASRRWIVMS